MHTVPHEYVHVICEHVLCVVTLLFSCVIAVHVIVATPGRILDLMEKKIANMSQCQILVLDEADKLLSMDYQNPLDRIISFLPSDRQILLYSATFPVTIRGFMVSAICPVLCGMDCVRFQWILNTFCCLNETLFSNFYFVCHQL